MSGFLFTLIQRDAITARLSRFLVAGLCGYRVACKNGVAVRLGALLRVYGFVVVRWNMQ